MRALATRALHRSVVRPARLAALSRRPMSSPPASAPDGAPVATEAPPAGAAPAAAPAAAAPAADDGPDFLKLDVRVGRIVSIERHPDADG